MEARLIRAAGSVDARLRVPPSKSYTARALIAASLAAGTSRIVDPSPSDDTDILIEALGAFGVRIVQTGGELEVTGTGGELEVTGTGGELKLPASAVDCGDAGTTMRFLVTLAALAPGRVVLTGSRRMLLRPVRGLTEALTLWGVRCSSAGGFPPVSVDGGTMKGGRIPVDASASSQYLSSMLLCAPYAEAPAELCVQGALSSRPYVDLTVQVMRDFGAIVEAEEGSVYRVSNRARYSGRTYAVEADASSASAFLAAALVARGRVVITNLPPGSPQGDMGFPRVLEAMGGSITAGTTGIDFRGRVPHGIEVDMNAMPDCVPALAVAAAFAEGRTTISNVAHLRHKESDRLAALASELSRIGARVSLRPDGFTVEPGPPRPAAVETYNDHRIAMSFAAAGLRIKGISILNPACVSKSFPGFWEEFSKLESTE